MIKSVGTLSTLTVIHNVFVVDFVEEVWVVSGGVVSNSRVVSVVVGRIMSMVVSEAYVVSLFLLFSC